MKRTLPILFTLLALGTVALAQTLPAAATVTVTNDNGTQVGSGTIANGHLSLSLQTGQTGFVTITITDPATSRSQSFDAMVANGGRVTIVQDKQFQSLTSFAKGGGVASVTVTPTPPSGNQTSSSDSSPDQSASAEDSGASSKPDGSSNDQAGNSGSSDTSGKAEAKDGSGSKDSSPDSASSGDQHNGSSAGDSSGSKDSSPDASSSSSGDDSVNVGSNLGGGSSSNASDD